MPSVPLDAPHGHPATHPERMARVDGCPDCVTNTEPPYVVRDHGTWYIAHYMCSDCEHFWQTSWADA